MSGTLAHRRDCGCSVHRAGVIDGDADYEVRGYVLHARKLLEPLGDPGWRILLTSPLADVLTVGMGDTKQAALQDATDTVEALLAALQLPPQEWTPR